MLIRRLGTMSHRISATAAAAQRTRAIVQHMKMSSQATVEEDPVVFESNLSTRTYILNRPKKLNALDGVMLDMLRPKIEEWSKADLCKIIVARGTGRAFCAGGDVASVVLQAEKEATRPQAVDFFKREFEMDLILGTLEKPYVAVMDGITMGGGAGLSMLAPFRIGTERTRFAMPEAKIGYCPDVGASYFLSRLDGELGAYLSLTSSELSGREVFELGLATHYVHSSRIPALLDALASLESATFEVIDATIDEQYSEPDLPITYPTSQLTGAIRAALDKSFRYNSVEGIFDELTSFAREGLTLPDTKHKESQEKEREEVKKWAQATLDALKMRSPTSLTVGLEAIRRGKKMDLESVLTMELGIATAFINGASPDFITGVRAVLIDKLPKDTRPQWQPPTIESVSQSDIISHFFSSSSTFLKPSPHLDLPEPRRKNPAHNNLSGFALPTESEIEAVVRGNHRTSGDFGLTLEEIVKKCEKDLRGGSRLRGKLGIREKVVEVVRRRCEVDKEGKWVRWK